MIRIPLDRQIANRSPKRLHLLKIRLHDHLPVDNRHCIASQRQEGGKTDQNYFFQHL